jgi:hypothetical protein
MKRGESICLWGMAKYPHQIMCSGNEEKEANILEEEGKKKIKKKEKAK